jgi:hypothetical protein
VNLCIQVWELDCFSLSILELHTIYFSVYLEWLEAELNKKEKERSFSGEKKEKKGRKYRHLQG